MREPIRRQRLSLTSEELQAGYRRPADVPRLKYIAKALDGRSSFITIDAIKRAMQYAAEDGIRLDPNDGSVLKADLNKKPKRKARKQAPKKAPETPAEPSEAPVDAEVTKDAPAPPRRGEPQDPPAE